MAKAGKAGWIVAGVFALLWLGASSDEPAEASRPEVLPATAAVPSDPVETSAPPAAPEPPTRLAALRSSTAPLATIPAYQERTAYASTRLRVRDVPSTEGAVLATLDPAATVTVIGEDGAWRQIRSGRTSGWAHGDYLQDRPPAPSARARSTAVPLISSTAPSRAGQPMRQPYVGTCDCPYDVMRNGRRCGGNSAYSRPGGRSPQCFF